MDDRFYFTYIIASRSRTLYVGVTSDLRRRVFQHKQKAHPGFTARYNCNRLVWFESFSEVSAAIQREKEIKGWTPIKKIGGWPKSRSGGWPTLKHSKTLGAPS
jgi:putative endonuclease